MNAGPTLRALARHGLAACCLTATTVAGAAPIGLAGSNPAALARSFALPALPDSAGPEPGADAWRIALELSSEYVFDEEGGESLLLDGESQTYSLQYQQRSADGALDWGIGLVLIHAGGGFMDGLIENWHQAFNLPDGGREDAPRDDYRYRYQRDGATVLDLGKGGTRLGDVLLGTGLHLGEALSLRGQLKLPTGEEKRLSGGTWAAALWGEWGLPLPRASDLEGSVAAGFSVNEDARLLGSLQNSTIPFGGLALRYRVLPAVQLLGHVYLHAPLYEDTEIDALRRPGAQLELGIRGCPRRGPCLELSFQEDLAVGASPDFSLRFALSSR